MFQQFRTIRFRQETRDRIDQINEILDEYDGQKLTARQVYYQFVARDLIPNAQSEYSLDEQLAEARAWRWD